MEHNLSQISFTISSDLKNSFKAMCAQRGITMKELIIHLMTARLIAETKNSGVSTKFSSAKARSHVQEIR